MVLVWTTEIINIETTGEVRGLPMMGLESIQSLSSPIFDKISLF